MISLIIPVYNEAYNLASLNSKVIETLGRLGKEYEVVYVDDNSIDDSYKLLEGFADSDSNVRAIRLARNFGQTLAIQAGIDNSVGDIIIIMDADLQNDPADIPRLLQKIGRDTMW